MNQRPTSIVPNPNIGRTHCAHCGQWTTFLVPNSYCRHHLCYRCTIHAMARTPLRGTICPICRQQERINRLRNWIEQLGYIQRIDPQLHDIMTRRHNEVIATRRTAVAARNILRARRNASRRRLYRRARGSRTLRQAIVRLTSRRLGNNQ